MLKLNKKQSILTAILLLVFIYIAVSIFNIWSAGSYGQFVKISDMNVPRAWLKSILLQDGRVLIIAGGINNNTAEIYDPKKNKFTLNDSFLEFSTTTLLPNGKVLITGCIDNKSLKHTFLKNTILFNPKTDKFEQGPNMIYPRVEHTATLLPNGNVLIAGGENYNLLAGNFRIKNKNLRLRNYKNRFIKNAEIYDYKQNKFVLGPKIINPRFHHQAMRLTNGNVLIIGGVKDVSKDLSAEIHFYPMEIYDYKNNTFKIFDKSQNIGGIVELSNDRFLTMNTKMHGGAIDTVTFTLYKVQNNEIQKIQSFKPKELGIGSASFTQLDDNRLLLTGVRGVLLRIPVWTYCTADSYIYDIKSNRIIKINKMTMKRSGHSSLKIDKGRVLILGGNTSPPFGEEIPTNKAEMFVYKETNE